MKKGFYYHTLYDLIYHFDGDCVEFIANGMTIWRASAFKKDDFKTFGDSCRYIDDKELIQSLEYLGE